MIQKEKYFFGKHQPSIYAQTKGQKVASKSKAKGSSWERAICAKLITHFGDGFWRTISSGAFVGGKNAVRKQFMTEGHISATKGDISTPEHMPHLVIEAKNYADFLFHHLYTECKQLDTWIKQLEDCMDDGDYGILIFKITRKGEFVAVPIGPAYFPTNHTIYGKYAIYEFSTFLENNKDLILQLSK